MSKRKELSLTIAVHAIIIGLLFHFGLSVPLPVLSEQLFHLSFIDGNESEPQPATQFASLIPNVPADKVVTQDVVKSVAVHTSEKREQPQERTYLYSAMNTATEVEASFPLFESNAKGGQDLRESTDNSPVSIKMAGRTLLSISSIDEEYTETGKVVLHIKVDPTGKVLLANYTPKGSTTSNQQLIRLAEEAALQARFSAKGEVAEEQFGTITFTFKLK